MTENSLNQEQEERRRFLATARNVALTMPAATVLLAASTKMAMPYGSSPAMLGNPGNNLPVGRAGDQPPGNPGGDGIKGASQ